ncbi:MAG TPA: ABC transporter ATP-binding protein [Candidatus Nanopelagicales bacterium]|nr:ABC transporter ATP-binding protein [Candidatus Nanopelagicales bacterium]
MSAYELTVRFGHVLALDDVSLQTPTGQITAVVGGDGAGKTTLLEALVDLVPIEAGSVDSPARSTIGFMPAGAGSWSELSVDENVAFVGGSYGLATDVLTTRADDLLTRAGLSDVRDRLAGQLSGGMRKKLGFCLAMLHEPQLLILDEPSTGLDPVSRVELWRLISEAAARGTAVVLTTTYLDEAERAGTVLVLERGKALLSGSPQDVVSSYPGVIVQTDSPTRPQFAWRHGTGYREWWPDDPPKGSTTTALTLEDVSIVASLRQEVGS